MPYVPPELKERIKREVSIQRLAEARGIKLRRHGRSWMGLCPFHKDTNPSLSIDPGKNEWKCFGCGRGGDVIEWVKNAEGVSFTHAVELLKKDFLPLTKTTEPPPKKSTVAKLPSFIEHTKDDKKLLEMVVSYYHKTLKQSPEAQQYLVKRGLKSAEMIDHFRLGFSNRSLAYYLPASNRNAGEEQRGRLKELGILRKESGHEHFRGSLVIPIFNLEGDVVQMYARKLLPDSKLRDGSPRHMYLPGPMRGVWNEQALIASKEIILCEALIDALTFWCSGFRHVTSIYGVNGFNDELRAALKRYGTKRIYIAYDRDQAGERAALAHSEELMAMGIECFRVQFPKDEDANEFALKQQPAPKWLGMYLNRAVWLGKGKRPSVSVKALPVSEPEPQIEQETKPAAKEKIIEEKIIEPAQEKIFAESVTEAAKEKISAPMAEESVLPLAVNPEPEPHEEAAPMPEHSIAMLPDIPLEIRGDEILIRMGPRTYRVLGLEKNTSIAVLRVNVRVSSVNLRGEFCYHGDTFDMNLARQRAAFIKQTAQELGVKEEVIHREVGQVWMKLDDLNRDQIKKALEKPPDEIEMTEEDRRAAMELLRDPRLLDRILADFEKCGVVGEEINKQVGYLAVVSRLLEAPLAVLVQSSSAAGKSSLMESILAFSPDEHRVEYSAMTGQALFYMGETDLKNKVLAIAEEEGAQRAAYALKLLQSERKLSIASTGKDPNSGRLITHQYRVEGPVMIFLTTTAIDLDEELMNRCLVLTVNEDREQTKAIHQKQRESQTLEGLLRRQERIAILNVHRNAQRLLKPVAVVNPYAENLTYPASVTRTRRDHMKYLTLISAVTLLHQYQRPRKTATSQGKPFEYIEVTWDDIELATRLALPVLGRSLDELQPQTRNLLLLIDEMASHACDAQQIERAEFRFSRRDVREFTKWSDSQLKRHMHRLEELEYLIVHRGGRGQSMVYELYFQNQGDWRQPFLPGLIDFEKLKGCNYDAEKSGVKGEKSGPSLAQVRGMSGGGAGEESPVKMGLRPGFYENLEKSTVRASAPGTAVIAQTRPNGTTRTISAGAK